MRNLHQQALQAIRNSRPRDRWTVALPRPTSVCLFCRQASSLRKPGSNASRDPGASSIRSSRSFSASSSSPGESCRPQTFYELFSETLPCGPPPQGPFTIDVRRLRDEFLQLQRRAHPDRHRPEARNRAEATSTLINEAYKTLQNPLLRAQYLLSLRGIETAEDETAKTDDPELLMQVLEAREMIEEAEEEVELEPLRQANDGRIEESLKELEKAFESDDIVSAKEQAVKLRYWMNIKQSLDDWEKGKPVVLVH